METRTTRRELLARTAARGLVLATAGAAERASASAHVPIVDTHQHLWDMRKFSPPWLKGPAEVKINKPCTMRDYLRETAGLNVVKTVYMEVDVDPRQQVEEAEWVIEACGRHDSPLTAAVISARPALPGFAPYAKRFSGSKVIKGVRQVLQVPEAAPGLCLSPEYVRSIRLCGELGLTFDLCMRPAELSDGAKLADLCPHTRFVLDHCGNAQARDPTWTRWEKDIAALARRKNVVCKVSGIIKTVKPEWNAGEEMEPIIRHVVDSFGPERVMFGGDWPVCNKTSSFRGWVAALDYAIRDATDTDRRKLYHDNASRFYGLG